MEGPRAGSRVFDPRQIGSHSPCIHVDAMAPASIASSRNPGGTQSGRSACNPESRHCDQGTWRSQ